MVGTYCRTPGGAGGLSAKIDRMDLMCSFCGGPGLLIPGTDTREILPLSGAMAGATCGNCFRNGIRRIEDLPEAARPPSRPCAYCCLDDRAKNPLEVGYIPICEECAEILQATFSPERHGADYEALQEIGRRRGIKGQVLGAHYGYKNPTDVSPDTESD